MDTKKKKRVFVGMSGGVDSSVAALLLKKEGYDVTGVFINGFNVDGCSEKDAEDARRTADHIGIPFYVLDAREDYFDHVVQYMIEGYKNGITPNPDVMCNKEIKFGVFLDKALKLGADYIATGHYIRLLSPDVFAQSVSGATPKSYSSQKHPTTDSDMVSVSDYRLSTAKDKNKDQSYFLWTLTQEQLKHCLFPIGKYTKPEIRKIAENAGLPTAEKKDSQGVCFLGKVKLPDFLKEYIEPKKGDVLDTDGNKIGEHEGIQFYTIGQRHLNIHNNQSSPNIKKQKTNQRPYYVVNKDIRTNRLVVADGDDNPALFKHEVMLTGVHFIGSDLSEIKNLTRLPDGQKLKILCRVRYRQPLVNAALFGMKDGSYKIEFAEPVKFIAPGQSAVFYSENADENGNHEMLGGGVILE